MHPCGLRDGSVPAIGFPACARRGATGRRRAIRRVPMDPTDPFFEAVYLIEILAQRRASRAALARFDTALAAYLNRDPASERIAEVFDAAAHFLQHAAIVSKILWPPPESDAKKRATAEARG